jgi:predicted ester cyclase
MSVEENVKLMRRWFQEVWNERNTQTIHDLVAPNAVTIGQIEDGQPLRGPAEFAAFAERILGAFSGIHFVVEDAFGAGDKVVARWSATMTHSGDHLGMPATGKQVRLTGISVVRVSGNQFVEGWDSWDQLGLMKQLGVYQVPAAALLKSA